MLRAEAANAADDAAEAGREVARWQFEEALDVWIDRHSNFDVVADENRDSCWLRRGVVDWIEPAAAHLARGGMKVPRGWRSPDTGEALHDHSNPSAHKSGTYCSVKLPNAQLRRSGPDDR